MGEGTADDIARQLARLQKNRGLQSVAVLAKVGPDLARLLGIDSATSANEARCLLVTALIRAADVLSPDLKLAFTRGLAIRVDDLPTLEQRLDAVGTVIKRQQKATRDRLAAANLLVAQQLINDAAVRDRGWYIGSMTSSVDLRESLPVYRATRTLVVTALSLDQLSERFAFPGVEGSPAPEYNVKGAATVAGVERLPGDIWHFTMTLDKRYHRGDHIEYTTALRLPARRFLTPMSVMAPTRECWQFSTTVDFGGLVRDAWVLDSVPVAAAYSDTPSGRRIDPVAEPRATVTFQSLQRGNVYGLRWLWTDPDTL